ncbi:MAG TPA: hypothetical protein VK973_05050 [Arenicellales bacterium]|nr:hypothetical protein [Arenicellales bacterium]
MMDEKSTNEHIASHEHERNGMHPKYNSGLVRAHFFSLSRTHPRTQHRHAD